MVHRIRTVVPHRLRHLALALVVVSIIAGTWALLPQQRAKASSLSEYPAVGSNNVSDHGGEVIKNPVARLIFEGLWFASDMQSVQQYFADVSGSAFEGILTQYSGISNTITVSGSMMDANFYYGNDCGTGTIGDDGFASPFNDIWDELNAHGSNNGSTINFIFTPPGYSVFNNGTCRNPTCGYHSKYLLEGWIYAVIPWGGGPCGTTDGSALDTIINTTSHEQFEAITNPSWSWWNGLSGNGWYNTDSGCGNPCEIGDKCSNQHPGLYLNGDSYYGVQGEYNNATGDCVYPAIPPPTPTPAPPTPTSPPAPTATPLPPTPTPLPASGNLLINPSFEGYNGWCVWDNWGGGSACNSAYDNSFVESSHPPHSGSSYRAHWSGTSWYDVTTYQVMAAPVGAYYSASLWVETGCTTSGTYFFLKNTNTGIEYGTIHIGACYQGWTYFAINHIWFDQGQPLAFEVHSVNNGPNMWIRFDDAYLCYNCWL